MLEKWEMTDASSFLQGDGVQLIVLLAGHLPGLLLPRWFWKSRVVSAGIWPDEATLGQGQADGPTWRPARLRPALWCLIARALEDGNDLLLLGQRRPRESPRPCPYARRTA